MYSGINCKKIRGHIVVEYTKSSGYITAVIIVDIHNSKLMNQIPFIMYVKRLNP